MPDYVMHYIKRLFDDLESADSTIVIAILLLCSIVVIYDIFRMLASKKSESSGFTDEKFRAAIKDTSNELQKSHHYVSDMQLLSGTPDAVISEDGYLIPVEHKPLAKKIRDRYVAQLLVYMRLVEEFEGKKPPYGYLLLGKNCRRVKIQNSSARQAWLQKIIDEMQDSLQNGTAIVPHPQAEKCKKCSVREYCKHRADKQE